MSNGTVVGLVCNSLYKMRPNGTCDGTDGTWDLGLKIIGAVSEALGNTAALGFVGFLLARWRQLGPEALLAMRQYARKIAIPCQFFCVMAAGVKLNFLEHAWFVLLMPLMHVLAGLLLGFVVSVLVPHRSDFRGFIMACVAMPNSPGVPVVLLNAITVSMVPPELNTRLGAPANPITYLTLYLVCMHMLKGGVGAICVNSSANQVAENAQLDGQPEQEGTHDSCSKKSTLSMPTGQQLLLNANKSDALSSSASLGQPTDWTSAAFSPGSKEMLLNVARQYTTPVGGPRIWPGAMRWCEKTMRMLGGYFEMFFQPSTIGSVLGLLVSYLPGSKTNFVSDGGDMYWLFKAISDHGDAAVPIMSMMLGANLALSSASNLGDGLGFLANLAIAVAKLIIMPFLGVVSYYYLADWISMCTDSEGALCPANDAMWLAILVVTAAPTCTTLVVMTSLADQKIGKARKESEMPTMSGAISGVLRMQYVLTPFALTMSLTLVLFVIATHGVRDRVDVDLTRLNSCNV